MTYDKAKYVELDKKHVWHHLTQHKNFEPAIYVKGEGMRITDIDGKTYIDAVSGGVWTVNVGYGRKEIVDAVAKQMLEMCYFANGIGNIYHTIFVDICFAFLCFTKLCFISCCNTCIFCQNSDCIGNSNLSIAINVTRYVGNSWEITAINQQVCNCCMTGCGRVHICICNIDICPCMMQECVIDIYQINLSILSMCL